MAASTIPSREESGGKNRTPSEVFPVGPSLCGEKRAPKTRGLRNGLSPNSLLAWEKSMVDDPASPAGLKTLGRRLRLGEPGAPSNAVKLGPERLALPAGARAWVRSFPNSDSDVPPPPPKKDWSREVEAAEGRERKPTSFEVVPDSKGGPRRRVLLALKEGAARGNAAVLGKTKIGKGTDCTSSPELSK